MSAIDDLRTFERDWERHLAWRENQKGDVYLEPRPSATLRLHEVPGSIRERFLAQFDEMVTTTLDALAAQRSDELKAKAVDEAEGVLRELGPKERTGG